MHKQTQDKRQRTKDVKVAWAKHTLNYLPIVLHFSKNPSHSSIAKCCSNSVPREGKGRHHYQGHKHHYQRTIHAVMVWQQNSPQPTLTMYCSNPIYGSEDEILKVSKVMKDTCLHEKFEQFLKGKSIMEKQK